jgi:tetratricopeptide (TPR) repeat protein
MIDELRSALKDCDAALEIRPRYVDALDSRGFVNLKLGQPSNAIADYDAALRINPKHASALYGRGIAKLRIGNNAGGNGDIAAAKLIQRDIADEFASYGIR